MRRRQQRRMPATSSAHARALMRNQAISVILYGEIVTTTAKAKAVRPFVERLITRSVRAVGAAAGGERVSQFRILNSRIRSAEALDVLLNVLSRLFAARPGGYTRILKCGFRKGDGAELSVLQIVTEESPLDEILPMGLAGGAGVPKDRYAFLRDYCLSNRQPSHKVLDRWMRYPFPEVQLEMLASGRNAIHTTITLPEGERWNKEAWPSVHGSRVPMELTLRFYADAETLEESTLAVDQASLAPGIRTFPLFADGTALPFVFDPFAHKGVAKLVVKHVFSGERPSRFSAMLANPYRALKSARWIDPKEVDETRAVHSVGALPKRRRKKQNERGGMG